MGETARHMYMKEKAKQQLSVEYDIVDKEEFLSEQAREIKCLLNGVETTYTLRADLLHPTKKIWVEVGLLDPRKESILRGQKEYIFRYFPYCDLPPEYHKNTEIGTWSFDEIHAKLKMVGNEVFEELRYESNFSLQKPPKIDEKTKKSHRVYLRPVAASLDYFNLPVGEIDDEDKIRNKWFYCGISLNEFGKFSVFIESTNKSPIIEFMKRDYNELVGLLNNLHLAKYSVKAGFGYSIRNSSRPYYHSWSEMKEGVTDCLGNRITPTKNVNFFEFETNKITKEDFEFIYEYFNEMLEANDISTVEERRYPRLSIVGAYNLKEEELIPILKEIGPAYNMLRKVRTQHELAIEKVVLDNELLEILEERDFENALSRLKNQFAGFDNEKDIRKIVKDSRIIDAIKNWNSRIDEEIRKLNKEKSADIHVHVHRNTLKDIYSLLPQPPICSLEKFINKCERYR